jgi:hypothetical protein
MIICNQCGSSVENNLSYCTECGAETAAIVNSGDSASQADASVVAPTAPATSEHRFKRVGETGPMPQQRRSPTFALAFVGTTAVLALIGVIALMIFKGDATESSASQVSSSSATNSAVRDVPDATTRQAPDPQLVSPDTGARNRGGRSSGTLSESVVDEIKQTLHAWANAVNNHDLSEHMRYFANTLDVYHRARNVSSAKIRSDLEPSYLRYPVMRMSLSNIEIALDPSQQSAVVVLDKSWRFESPARTWANSVQQKIWLKKEGGIWLLTGIKDL